MADGGVELGTFVLLFVFFFFYGCFVAIRKKVRIDARDERIRDRVTQARTQRLNPRPGQPTTINKNPALQPTYANSTTNPTLAPVTAPTYAAPSHYPPTAQPSQYAGVNTPYNNTTYPQAANFNYNGQAETYSPYYLPPADYNNNNPYTQAPVQAPPPSKSGKQPLLGDAPASDDWASAPSYDPLDKKTTMQ